MKKTNIREYTQAFYRGSRLTCAAVILLTILGTLPNLVCSWILGEVLDVVTTRDLQGLLRMLYLLPAVLLANFLLESGRIRLKSRFIHGAMARYKALAFSRLSEKSISAFSTENTSRYLSVLNNDIASIEENYLNRFLGQFTRNYTQTVKRAADNKRRYAPGEGSIPPVLLSGVSKGVPPLAHDFACKV